MKLTSLNNKRDLNTRLPYHGGVERAIVAVCLHLTGALEQARRKISVETFYHNDNVQESPERKIFRLMCEQQDKGQPYDVVTLTGLLHNRGELEAFGGPYAVAQMGDHTRFNSTPHHLSQFLQDAISIHSARELAISSSKIQLDVTSGKYSADEVLERAQRYIDKCKDIKSAAIGEDELEPITYQWDAEITEAETVWYIDGNPFGRLGEIMPITGKSKSRKSAVVRIAIASSACSAEAKHWEECREFAKMRINPRGGRVVYLDTEQSKNDFTKLLHTSLKAMGELDSMPGNIGAYCLVEKDSHKEKIHFIDKILEKESKLGKISVIILDNVRDLVGSINDEEDAAKLKNHLLRWRTKYNCLLVPVFHTNESNDEFRGWLGVMLKQIMNNAIGVSKAEPSFDCPSSVFAKLGRSGYFKAYEILETSDRVPYAVGTTPPDVFEQFEMEGLTPLSEVTEDDVPF